MATNASHHEEYDMQKLVDVALKNLDKIPPNSIHCVISAAYTKDNTIITAFNVTHFTGGPCAEQALIGAAAAQGYLPKDLRCIVAVVEGRRTVINPCGKCRQIMLDLCDEIKVIVRDAEGNLSMVGVEELLPFPYPDRSSKSVAVTAG